MKETNKQTIERQQKELQQAKSELEEYKALCSKQNAEILEMQERADKGFLNSSDYIQMNNKIDYLEKQNKQLETRNKSLDDKVQKLINEIDKYKSDDNIHKLNNETVKVHNERGAGRKTKFSEQEKETIKMYRIQGKTIKEIAQMYNCSVGLIHKLINE